MADVLMLLRTSELSWSSTKNMMAQNANAATNRDIAPVFFKECDAVIMWNAMKEPVRERWGPRVYKSRVAWECRNILVYPLKNR